MKSLKLCHLVIIAFTLIKLSQLYFASVLGKTNRFNFLEKTMASKICKN